MLILLYLIGYAALDDAIEFCCRYFIQNLEKIIYLVLLTYSTMALRNFDSLEGCMVLVAETSGLICCI